MELYSDEPVFRQLLHCQFRDNIIRLLWIPTLDHGHVFTAVDKFGRVGLYHPDTFSLIHTYTLDLQVPMRYMQHHHSSTGTNNYKNVKQILLSKPSPPKCGRTHLVTDAVFASDVKALIFATSKSILQWYDIGDIEHQSLGLEIYPSKEFLNLKHGLSPVPLKNKGHAETHRVYGLPGLPYCMSYYTRKAASKADDWITCSKLLIGDTEGGITIIKINDPKLPLGERKIRGKVHEISYHDLESNGIAVKYIAHLDLVLQVDFLKDHNFIVSCSKDRKYSMYFMPVENGQDECKDGPEKLSVAKGVNCFTFCDSTKILATGSDDCIIRLFRIMNKTVLKSSQMDLYGHKTGILGVEFYNVPFSHSPMLVSYSKDVEIKGWDPQNFVNTWSVYGKFPPKSNITCKTPEFAKRPIFIHQPHYHSLLNPWETSEIEGTDDKDKDAKNKKVTSFGKGSDGQIILLYCNSFAKLDIVKEERHWPFDFDDFMSEFDEMTAAFEKKLKHKFEVKKQNEQKSDNSSSSPLNKEELKKLETKLDLYVQDILKVKLRVDKEYEIAAGSENSCAKITHKKMKEVECKIKSHMEPESDWHHHEENMFNSMPMYELDPISFSLENLPLSSGSSFLEEKVEELVDVGFGRQTRK